MEGIKQKSKRHGRVWKHRALISVGLFLFFLAENSLASPIPTTTVSKTYPYRSSKKILTARLSSSHQKPSSNGKTSSRSSSTRKRQKARQKTGKRTGKKNGYKVSYVKPGGMLDKIRIKKGDTIKQLAGKPVYSKKQIRKRIAAISKKQKGFSVWLERNRKNFLVSYKVSSLKPGGIKIAKVKKMNSLRRGPFQKSKRGIASASSVKKDPVKKDPIRKNPAKKKFASKKEKQRLKKSNPSLKAKNLKVKDKAQNNPLILKKYQENLQRAYVIAAYSIIYKQANFDSDKIHSLHKGSKIIISKKIFRPAHNFGSFYKVFLSSPKKIVGYISEVDLAPEFIKKEDQETPNPAYLLARKQLKEGKVLDVSFSPQGHSPLEKQKGRSSSSKSRHYLGVFAGFSGFQPEVKDIFVGLKLSGYGLLISSLNMDINLSISPYDFKFFHSDVLISLPLMKTRLAQLFVMGGLKFDINKRVEDIERRNDPGFAGAAALIFPFRSFLLFRLEAKTEYGLASREVQTNFSAVLQAGF